MIAIHASAAAAAPAPQRISVSTHGRQGNGGSGGYVPHTSDVSADGRFVVFQSEATNLVRGDTNGAVDVFVRDRRRGTTRRVSTRAHGGQRGGGGFQPAISADGRFVAFIGDTGHLSGGFRRRVGLDAFLHDRRTGRTIRVSRRYRGAPRDRRVVSVEVAISGDGRFVAYVAQRYVTADVASVGLFVYDRRRRTTRRIRGVGRDAFDISLSNDGRRIAFFTRGDRDTPAGMYVRDRRTGRTLRVRVTGSPGESSISADGRFVAFERRRRGGYSLYVRDLRTGRTRFAGHGVSPSLSRHGGRLAFQTIGADGSLGGGEVYLRDVRSGRTRLVSATPRGRSGDSASPALSRDGHVVAFSSSSADLVAGDTNGVIDVFVRRFGVRG